MPSDTRVEELADVDMTQRADGAVLTYNAARQLWQATTQAATVSKADLDSAIAIALATLRVR